MSHDADHVCACGGNCSCQDDPTANTMYLTREEYIARLERYLQDLKAEIISVEKELAELRQVA